VPVENKEPYQSVSIALIMNRIIKICIRCRRPEYKIESLIAIVYLMEKYTKAGNYSDRLNNICTPDPKYPMLMGLVPMPLECFGEIILVDKQVYMNAYDHGDDTIPNRGTVTQDGFKHTMEPKIDGENYPQMVLRCMEMIYCAGYPCHAPIETPAIPFNDIYNLPAHLSVIEWCCVLKPTDTYRSYVSRVRDLIQQAIDIIRAIHSDNFDMHSASKRIKTLSDRVPNDMPLPKCLEAIDVARCECTYIAYACTTCGGYRYSRNDTERRKQVQSYTWKLYERTLKNEHPDFLQIHNFGPECARAVTKLFKPEEISITKEYDITDIFIHGIIVLHQ
jgi:hypothetical protein